MRKKVISFILSLSVASASLLSGCGNENQAINDTSYESNEISDSDATSNISTENTVSNEAASKADSISDETSDESDTAKGSGGKPWINSELKENISADTVVNPKDDFHLYANKEWLLKNEIPDGYSSWSHYSERGLDVKKECMELLKDESIEGHDAELIRAYNNLILDWDTRNSLGVSELQDKFDLVLSAKNIDDITKLLTDEDTVLEYYDFVGYSAGTGLNDPDTYIVYIVTPNLILQDSSEYSERTDYGDIFYNVRKEQFSFIAGKFGMSEADALKYYEAAIDLETKLSKEIYSTKDRLSSDYYDKINNEMTYEDVVALSKVFPLDSILTNSGYKYDGTYLVIRPDYFTLLDELYTNDNLEGIKGLILTYFVINYANFLDRECYEKNIELNNTYFGTSGAISDEEMAYNKVVDALPTSMQKVYIEKYGSEEDKQKMTELCQEVIDTYREMLSENTWASDEVKSYAIEKLDKIKIHAAYPDKFRDTSAIDISDCSLIEATDRIESVALDYDISLIGTKVDKDMWAEGFNILECNAFYDPSENTINMIIGMMGEPFYSSNMSTEELYASIGAFWVGHEVSHAFDSNGAQFDADGSYRDWWTEEDKKEFDNRIKKMDNYLDTIIAFGDNHFIGSNIDTEMAADMTGLQCALKMASKVEGFDYDKFFTKFAQMNASLGVYSSELSQLLQDEHPLNYSRTNVPVQQFEEFYKTYDVQEGDNMYLAPEDRLVIW